jgi:hypothetical protein
MDKSNGPAAADPDNSPHHMDPAQFGMAVQLINHAQSTFADWRMEMAAADAQPISDVLLSMAMCTFAGTIYGGLVSMGLVEGNDEAVDAMLETMALNFKQGIEAGIKAQARAAQEAMADLQAAETKQ